MSIMTLSSLIGDTRFPLGKLVMTAGVAAFVSESPETARGVISALKKYVNCEWGDLCAEDIEANRVGLREGFRIMGSYKVAGRDVWIITEGNRYCTTILFPEEY